MICQIFFRAEIESSRTKWTSFLSPPVTWSYYEVPKSFRFFSRVNPLLEAPKRLLNTLCKRVCEKFNWCEMHFKTIFCWIEWLQFTAFLFSVINLVMRRKNALTFEIFNWLLVLYRLRIPHTCYVRINSEALCLTSLRSLCSRAFPNGT